MLFLMCIWAACRGPPAEPPPLPWHAIVLLLVVNMSDPIAVTLLFPFAPVMVGAVRSRNKALDMKKAGTVQKAD